MVKYSNQRFNISKDYIIDYDRNKDYNQKNNLNYLPPYRSDFKSIYEGIEVEMHIVDHCNLNCNCCNHFSPIAEPWFISLEDFEEQLQLLKDNIPTLKRFLIIGGEPLLHPQFFELCQIARKVLGTDITIGTISNGTIINKIEEHKKEYLEMNIIFTFSSYMGYTKLDKIKELKPLGRVYNTRILSKQTLVDPVGAQDGFTNFFNCVDHKLPCFTLKEKKLYICPFSAHVEHFCKKFNKHIPEKEWIDYLPIDKIQGNLDLIQKFCFTPKNICNYCESNEDACPFDFSKKDYTEYTVPLTDLYFKDYPRYEEIMNAGKNNLLNWATNKKNNPGRVDLDFQTWNFHNERIRYGNGKIDIIIPYYNETIHQLIQLKENLLSQTIINDCMVYFISDGSNMDKAVINLFNHVPNFHCTFLRNENQSGPGVARNKGLKNSYNKYILFLDADDLFIKSTALEEMYEKISSNNYSMLMFAVLNETKTVIKDNFLIERDIINEYSLEYKSIYFGEDNEFLIRLITKVPIEKLYQYNNINNIFIEYNKTKGINITSTFICYDGLHFSYLTSNFIGIYETCKNKQYNNLLNSCIDKYLIKLISLLDENHLFLLENTFFKSLMYFILNEIVKLKPEYNNNNKHIIYLLNLFNMSLNNENTYIIYNYIKNYINDNYLNNEKLKTNAYHILTILNERIPLC